MLKLGPTVMVTLKAVLVTPEVKVSTETLDFGPVPTGKTKVSSAAGILAEACCHGLLGRSLVCALLSHCCLPALRLSSALCLLQVMLVMLQNPREVPADWQVKAPLEAGGAKDWAYFKAQPEQGVLPPGQKVLLKVTQ